MHTLMNYITDKKHAIEITIFGALLILALWMEHAGITTDRIIPPLHIAEGAEAAIAWLEANFQVVFDTIGFIIRGVLEPIHYALTESFSLVVFVLAAALGYGLGGVRLAIFITLALAVVSSMNYWEETMTTLSLVLTSTVFSLFIGIPLGIAKAHSPALTRFLDPILDFMQTMPLFVYLIPAVLFFSIGNIAGIIPTFIFATPAAIRLTSLGIEQIPEDLIEAGKAFGASRGQFLTKIELPVALPSIMMGVNQVIMLSLSMVVVASMIGAEGLGQEVLRGITRLSVGQGVASGIGVVLLAMILDRLTRTIRTRQA